jgi:uncharacterized protein YndB with AHSA1/START domain
MDITTTHSTFVIEHNYSYPPERLYAAFADPEKKRRWYGDRDSPETSVFEMDFRVGGRERTVYHLGPNTPFPGMPLTNLAMFEDIVPNQRIVMSSTMIIGDHRMSSSLVTIELLPSGSGTELRCTHQGAFYEGSDGPERREAGWRTLFDRFAQELEREVA